MRANEFVAEGWSQKYKKSINCGHPKGFSQRAHCAGKKKHNESIEMTCEDCGMCQTHGDNSQDNLNEACWKDYHKEGNKKLFGKTVPNCVKNEDTTDAEKSQPNILNLLRSWRNRVPAQYAWHLTKTFGDPHDVTNDLIIWHDKDGFKRIEIKDEYVMHTSPTPHYDYCYSYIDLKVPHKLSVYLADCSESILIDHLKNEVGARCASLAANAVTLNFVMDVIAGRARPSRDEYEQRIMDMHHDFENEKIFTIQWWPDQSHDTDPANPYYKRQHKSKPDVKEDKRITRKAGQPANLDINENLRDWFKDKWVRFGPDGKIRGDCARGSKKEGKPKCLPQSKAHALGKKGRASAAARKRRKDPNANRSGPAINVSTKGTKK